MKNEKSPDRSEPVQGGVLGGHIKDNQKLSKRQKKVYDLLRTGKHSVTDITIKLGYSDPRGHIRNLKAKGINIKDEWIIKDDVRYKLYWIPGPEQSNFVELFEKAYQNH